MLAEVKFSCGRHYLSVAGIAVALEGDRCRGKLPEEVLPPIPPEELEHATIGGKPAKDMPVDLVRFFRGDNWTEKMLRYTADRINEAARADALAAEVEALRAALEGVAKEADSGPCWCGHWVESYLPHSPACLAARKALGLPEPPAGDAL